MTRGARLAVDQLIINSPYAAPRGHWRYDPATRGYTRAPGRRPAGYAVATEDGDARRELPLVDELRARVESWRAQGYPGITGVTRRLLEHWRRDDARDHPLFFCQLEAIETLVWLAEAPASARRGVVVPGDGGPFARVCAKLATGGGKTVVMAMVIAWQVLNHVAAPRDDRFARHVLVVAPGLTVRERLRVLRPAASDSDYLRFNLVPPSSLPALRRGRVRVVNWHKLDWETAEQLARRRGVDKRGPKSDEAYARAVLRELSTAPSLVVLNDEAHHAWRAPPGTRGLRALALETATKWVGGLDRLHAARGIRLCVDFSATPYAPPARGAGGPQLFPWIVSDFGLLDAIESGLVKTPRLVARDARPSANELAALSRVYAAPVVRRDLGRRAAPEEPLPPQVTRALELLGRDWQATRASWRARGHATPPVMIVVANRTETAARVEHALIHGRVAVPELCDADRLLRIDSRALAAAEARAPELAQEDMSQWSGDRRGGRASARGQAGERLRRTVDTVGQPGRPGARVQCVISVQMLSEGWDARTVTHILGLRAFTSPLLCEQVVGRGLRRVSYEVGDDGLLAPEYVNVYGVPFTFIPHEQLGGSSPAPAVARARVAPDPSRRAYAMRWPCVRKLETVVRSRLTLDVARLPALTLDATSPVIDRAAWAQADADGLAAHARRHRLQRAIFEAAREQCERMRGAWPGERGALLMQLVRLVERALAAGRVRVTPEVVARDELRRRAALSQEMGRVAQHVADAVRVERVLRVVPVFDRSRPVRETGDVIPWYTARPCTPALKCHLSVAVHEDSWSTAIAHALDSSTRVEAWCKTDRLGFEVLHARAGALQRLRPAYLARLAGGATLMLERGEAGRDASRRGALEAWARAVTGHGGFGVWVVDAVDDPVAVDEVLARHATGGRA